MVLKFGNGMIIHYLRENNVSPFYLMHNLNNIYMLGFFNLEHCVFCHIISIGDDGLITIDANGYEHVTSMDQMILL